MTTPKPNADVIASRIASLTVAVQGLARRLNLTRRVVAALIVSVMIDLALSGLFIYQHQQQACRNKVSHDFFVAERTKVEGQIAGLERLKQGGEGNAVAGLNQFIDATRNYVVSIDRIRGHC